MDVTEPVRGQQYVLWLYLYVAMDFGPLAVKAGPCTGDDFVGGDEAAGGSHTWVCCDRSSEVQFADFLRDNAQQLILAGAEVQYLVHRKLCDLNRVETKLLFSQFQVDFSLRLLEKPSTCQHDEKPRDHFVRIFRFLQMISQYLEIFN